ncbi:ISJP4 transposase [Burkholderia pseudomallei]|nr:ISJP4 transposase [Burkholderia pseudomallei]
MIRVSLFAEHEREAVAPSGAYRLQMPRYYLHAPIIGALASQARHDSRPQSLMIRGVLSPGLVGGW